MKRLLAPALVLCLAAAGCGKEREPRAQASIGAGPSPCAGSGTVLDLGRPFRGGPRAEFTTEGGALRVTVRDFDAGGIFPPPKGTVVYVGPADRPPTYDEQSGAVSNVTARSEVDVNRYAPLTVAPGRYWLWSANGGNILLESCDRGGVSDPQPALPGMATPSPS